MKVLERRPLKGQLCTELQSQPLQECISDRKTTNNCVPLAKRQNVQLGKRSKKADRQMQHNAARLMVWQSRKIFWNSKNQTFLTSTMQSHPMGTNFPEFPPNEPHTEMISLDFFLQIVPIKLLRPCACSWFGVVTDISCAGNCTIVTESL